MPLLQTTSPKLLRGCVYEDMGACGVTDSSGAAVTSAWEPSDMGASQSTLYKLMKMS